MKVKDIANIIDLHRYSFRLLIKFYDEDGFFIGFMYKDNATNYQFISDRLYDVWRCCIYRGIADFMMKTVLHRKDQQELYGRWVVYIR